MTHDQFTVEPTMVDVPGARLAVWESGSGIPVLLLHGGTGTAAHDWGYHFGQLSLRSRAVALDLRGHGTSQDPSLELGVARFGMDVPHVMKALGIPKAILVGFSVGANSVVHLAARQPSLVHAIVAIGASAKGDPARIEDILTGPWPRELRSLNHAGASGDPDHWERLRAALARDWGENLDFLVNNAGLDAVTAPTWIVHGEDDPIVLPEQARRLAAALPDSHLVMVPDAGHQVHREQPEVFMRILDEALDTVEAVQRDRTLI